MKTFKLDKKALIELLFRENEAIREIFDGASGLGDLRKQLFDYFNRLEWSYFHIHSPEYSDSMHIIEKNIARECMRVLKNILQTKNEALCGFSALETLFSLYQGDEQNDRHNGQRLCHGISVFAAGSIRKVLSASETKRIFR
ncbi:MAG: hypothetical protein U5N26_03065 [Candidatus Marinimicrobia bacterium]|nr:hypothetical protein [Candidatus Neomarinimicrobiota bacterium]